VNQVRLLGVLFISSLKATFHVDTVLSIINQRLYLLSQLKAQWANTPCCKTQKINFGNQQKTGGYIACGVPCTSHENINNIANIIITVLHYRVAAFSGHAFSAPPRLLHFGKKTSLQGNT